MLLPAVELLPAVLLPDGACAKVCDVAKLRVVKTPTARTATANRLPNFSIFSIDSFTCYSLFIDCCNDFYSMNILRILIFNKIFEPTL